MSYRKLIPQVGDIVRVLPPAPGHAKSVYLEYQPGATFIVVSVGYLGREAYARCASHPNNGYGVSQLEVVHRSQIVALPKGGKVILNHGTRTAVRLAAPDTQPDEARLIGLRNNFLGCDTYPLSGLAKNAAKLYNETMQALHGSAYRAPKEVRKVDDSMPGVSRDELREKLRTKNKHLTEVLAENRELHDKLTGLRVDLALRTQDLNDQAARSLRLKEHVAKLESEIARRNQIARPDFMSYVTDYCAANGLTFAILNRTK